MRLTLIAFTVCSALAACSEAEDSGIAVQGRYLDDFGTTHTITDASWTQRTDDVTSVFHLLSFDNERTFAIGHNDAGNDFSPDKFSRLDWVNHDGELYFCQTAYDAASAEAAQGTTRGDDTDPATGGCGAPTPDNPNGFPWSKLTIL